MEWFNHQLAYNDPIFIMQELDDIWALLTGAAMDMAMAEAGGWHGHDDMEGFTPQQED